uniref:Ribokinase n=1 Tax=Thermofilum pendens TaxID=2269 RepID=A0A7C1PBK4_THEPE
MAGAQRSEGVVTVVGSIHVDFFIRVPRLPRPGETIKGHGFAIKPGGKGANQAVGCGRLGLPTFMVGRLGRDFSELLLNNFRSNRVSTDYVYVDEETNTGVAFILLSDEGENMIAFDPGADYRLAPDDVKRAESVISRSSVLLTQLEVPLETVETALSLAKEKGVTTILNPAPARELPCSLLRRADVVTPNRVEAFMLTGVEVRDVKTAVEAGRKLLSMGAGSAVITMGGEGAVVVTSEDAYFVPAVRVKPVDTTGAGDAFNAGLAFGLAQGLPLVEAARLGCVIAALKVTKFGAQEGLPWREELEEYLRKGVLELTTPTRV